MNQLLSQLTVKLARYFIQDIDPSSDLIHETPCDFRILLIALVAQLSAYQLGGSCSSLPPVRKAIRIIRGFGKSSILHKRFSTAHIDNIIVGMTLHRFLSPIK